MPAAHSTRRLAVLGVHISNDSRALISSPPSHVTVTPTGAATRSGGGSAAEVRAHEKHGAAGRTWDMSDEELYLFDTMVCPL